MVDKFMILDRGRGFTPAAFDDSRRIGFDGNKMPAYHRVAEPDVLLHAQMSTD